MSSSAISPRRSSVELRSSVALGNYSLTSLSPPRAVPAVVGSPLSAANAAAAVEVRELANTVRKLESTMVSANSTIDKRSYEISQQQSATVKVELTKAQTLANLEERWNSFVSVLSQKREVEKGLIADKGMVLELLHAERERLVAAIKAVEASQLQVRDDEGRVQEANRNLGTSIATVQSNAQRYAAELRRVEAILKGLQESNVSLHSDTKRVTSQMAAADASHVEREAVMRREGQALNQKVDEVRQRLTSTRQTLEDFVRSLEEAQKARARAAESEVQERIATRRLEIQHIHAEFVERERALRSELDHIASDTRAHIDAAISSLNQLRDENAQLYNHSVRLSSAIETLTEQAAGCQGLIDRMALIEAEINHARAALSALIGEVQNASTTVQMRNTSIDRLRAETACLPEIEAACDTMASQTVALKRRLTENDADHQNKRVRALEKLAIVQRENEVASQNILAARRGQDEVREDVAYRIRMATNDVDAATNDLRVTDDRLAEARRVGLQLDATRGALLEAKALLQREVDSWRERSAQAAERLLAELH
jgi:hypothetical protein